MGGFRFNSDESIRTFLMATQMAANQHNENQDAKLKMMQLDVQLAQQENARQVETARAKAELSRINHELELGKVNLGLQVKQENRMTQTAEDEAQYRRDALALQGQELAQADRHFTGELGLRRAELAIRAQESQVNIMRAQTEQQVEALNAQLNYDEHLARGVQLASQVAGSARESLATAYATHDVELAKLESMRPLSAAAIAAPLVVQDENGHPITQGYGPMRLPFLAAYNATGGDKAHGGPEAWIKGASDKMLAEARLLSIDQQTGQVNLTSDQFQGQVWNVVVERQITEDVAMAALKTSGDKFQELRDAAAVLLGKPGEAQPIEIQRARQVLNAHTVYFPKSGEVRFAAPGKRTEGGGQGVGVTDLIAPLAAVKLATGGYAHEEATSGGGLDQMVRAAQATGAAEAYNYIKQDVRVKSAERYIGDATRRSVEADVTLNTIMKRNVEFRDTDLAGLRDIAIDPNLDPRNIRLDSYVAEIDKITESLLSGRR